MSVATRHRDCGSASVWVLACCALLIVVAGVATIRGLAVLARHRTESAADLAALAGAGRIGVGIDPCGAAATVAHRNGATLSSCTVALDPGGRSGSVVVRVRTQVRLPLLGGRSVTASARAGRLPP